MRAASIGLAVWLASLAVLPFATSRRLKRYFILETPDKFIADFLRDIARWNRENRNP